MAPGWDLSTISTLSSLGFSGSAVTVMVLYEFDACRTLSERETVSVPDGRRPG